MINLHLLYELCESTLTVDCYLILYVQCAHFLEQTWFVNLPNSNIFLTKVYGKDFLLSIMKVLAAQLYPTLCDPKGCSLPSSSLHGILQSRILEWVAIPFSRRSSLQGSILGLLHCRQILYHLSHQESLLSLIPHIFILWYIICPRIAQRSQWWYTSWISPLDNNEIFFIGFESFMKYPLPSPLIVNINELLFFSHSICALLAHICQAVYFFANTWYLS